MKTRLKLRKAQLPKQLKLIDLKSQHLPFIDWKVMDIKFNNDGTIESLATQDGKNFLSRLGLIDDFGESKVTLFFSDHIQRIYKVYDEHGHDCLKCFKVKKYFWLVEKGTEHLICCCDCLLVIR